MAERVREALDTVSRAAKLIGQLGASKGGRARAKKLSDRRRKEIARKAAAARWGQSKAERE